MGTKENGIFLLGIGARAAGSYQLARALSKKQHVDFGFRYDYDMLEPIFNPGAGKRREAVVRGLEDAVFRPYSEWRGAPKSKLLSFLANPPSYFDHFLGVFRRSGICISGDFSQSHLKLSMSALQKIDTEFADRDIQLVPVFTMRNPVYLLKSLAEHRLKYEGNNLNYANLIQEMSKISASPEDKHLFDFPGTVKRLSACYGGRPVFLFFESLVEKNAIELLQKAVGVNLGNVAPVIGRMKRWESIQKLSVDDYNYFEEKFDDLFDFCEDAFPHADISRLWCYA